ncbi:MAG: 50S ribosomal protein L10 [Anaerolineae bacterium]|nr:50S ribosomal protein L10 [Anaerolineae bacterium]
MAITRERKEELVSLYGERLSSSDGIIIAEYSKMSVAQVNELRKRLREVGATYAVTKNTLFVIALRDAGWPVPDELLVGPVGVVFGNGNLPAAAKVVRKFITDFPDNLSAKGGIIAGAAFDAAQVEKIADLPTMDEIRAQLAGLIVTPAAQIAGLLQSATSQVVNVVQAYLDEQEKGAA